MERSQKESRILARVVDQSNQMICITNPKGFVPTYVNSAVKQIFGCTVQRFLTDKKTWEKSLHPDDKERVLVHFEDLYKSKHNGQITYRINLKTKPSKTILHESRWLYDDNGKALNLIGTIRDITEEQQFQETINESQKRLQLIFEHTSDAIFLIDIDHWKFVDFNIQSQILLGYSSEELLKLPVLEVFSEDQSSILGRLLQNCTSAKGYTAIETELRTIHDSIIPVECSISTAGIDGTNFIIASFRDIREKKGAIAERERLQKTREQIFVNTSHELKTPLTSIMIQTEMLAHEELGALTKNQKESLDLILRNVVRFNALISSILDISKINSGSIVLHLKKIKIRKLIEIQCKTFKPVAEQLNVKLINNVTNTNVICDENILERVFNILIENAIKFSKNGSVTMSAITTLDAVEISITDTGIGMDKKNFDKIFEPFFQVIPSFALSNKGTGLGLSIARGLINKINGKIWVESDGQSKGSVFKFTIPLKIINT